MTTINIKQSEGKKAIKNFLRITDEEEKSSEIFVVREVGGNGFKTWHMFKCPICGGHDFEAGQHQNCLNPECEFTIGDFEIERVVKNGEFDGYKIELDEEDENKKGELLELTKEDDDYENYHLLLEEYFLNKYKNKKKK